MTREEGDRRYSLQDLCVAMGISIGNAADQLGIGGPEYRKYRDEGMTRSIAERKAIKAGHHPYEVWPEMADHDAEAMQKVCAAEDCDERFWPALRHPHQRFCSSRCRSRVAQRRKYAANPEKKRAEIRAYDAANREYKRRSNRILYRQNREERIAYQKAYYEAHREEILVKRRGRYHRKNDGQNDQREEAA